MVVLVSAGWPWLAYYGICNAAVAMIGSGERWANSFALNAWAIWKSLTHLVHKESSWLQGLISRELYGNMYEYLENCSK